MIHSIIAQECRTGNEKRELYSVEKVEGTKLPTSILDMMKENQLDSCKKCHETFSDHK